MGPLEVHDKGERLEVGTPRTRVLLAVLLASPGQLVSVDRLVDELWQDDPPPEARTLIHSYVSRLRRVLRSGPSGEIMARRLVTRKPGYLLQVGKDELDLFRYQQLVADARAARGQERLALLRQADRLWHGPPFADVPHTPAVAAAALKLDELRLATLEEQFDVAFESADPTDLVTGLTELVTTHPLRERLVGQLMLALHQAGRTADALVVYRQTRDRLREELGVDPGPGLRRAHQTVITGQAPAVPVPCQLPSDLPTLVGRESALAHGLRVLTSTSPWVAVTGQGGVGKTAFALCLADRSRDLFPGGVLVAGRGSEPLDESVLSRFFGGFGVPVSGQLPDRPNDRAAMLWDLVAGRQVLVVLDNVPDETHVRPLFPIAAGCGLVVTSRRRLAGLDTLHPLPLDVLPVDAGVALLTATAGAGRVAAHATAAPSVVEVCDGLPLAIKVAGARLTARPNWTVEDLASRLSDTRSRLDWLDIGDLGVRTSLMESVSGLTADQRRLLCRLGLVDVAEFAGWVAGALLDLPAGPAERLLDDLVEAHLVEPAGHGLTGPRYRMHDLVRLTAAELAKQEDLAALDRVAHGWLAIAAAADGALAHWVGLDPGPAPRWRPARDTLASAAADAMSWFDEEHDALTRAVRQAATIGQTGVTWALAQRMSTYLELRGHYGQWHDVLTVGLGAADEAQDRQGQATMLGLLMQVAGVRDDPLGSLRYAALTMDAYRLVSTEPGPPPAGQARSTAPLDAARACGDALAVGLEASRLALTSRFAGEAVDYLGLLEEAWDAFRIVDEPLLELWALKNIGLVYCRQHRFADAEECMRRAQALLRTHGERILSGVAGGDLAGVAAGHGRADLAERLATEALDQARRSGDRWSAGRALITLAEVRANRGDHTVAADTYREALDVWRSLRMRQRITQVEQALTRLTSLRT